MRAMVLTRFGGPDVFEERDVPLPEPEAGQLLVRLAATSVNPVDYKIRQAGEWAGVKPPAIIGYDAAGVVEKVGAGVSDLKAGDAVFYTPEIFGRAGTYASHHVVDAAIVEKKPGALTDAQAAAVPLAGGTAWTAIVDRINLRIGETVLIHAAAGGVGSFAVQIAKAIGARIIATVSARNAEFVRSLGADRVIDYRREDFAAATMNETGGRGADAVFDTVGGETLSRSIDAVRTGGRIASIVRAPGDLNKAYLRNVTLHFVFLERRRATLTALKDLCDRRLLKPAIDSVLPLGQVAEAHRRLEAGGVRGKIVLDIR